MPADTAGKARRSKVGHVWPGSGRDHRAGHQPGQVRTRPRLQQDHVHGHHLHRGIVQERGDQATATGGMMGSEWAAFCGPLPLLFIHVLIE